MQELPISNLNPKKIIGQMLKSFHTIATCRNLCDLRLPCIYLREGDNEFILMGNEFIINGKVQRNLPVYASSTAHGQ